jgi:ADP-L-glycero-D-manno-heptose 6-epimerase
MRILITGHKGFIGKNLHNYLSNFKALNYTVEGFDQDLNEDLKFPDCSQYEWVIHLGAISTTTEKNVEKILKYNLEYSIELLSLCEKNQCNFQYASSASVYGNNKSFNENDSVYPLNPYAWSKYLFDRHVKKHYRDSNIWIQGFRYFNVYGNHEEHKKNQASPITKFSIQAQREKSIKLFENSNEYLRDFICVNDICKIHEKMLHQNVSEIFNVGTGSPISFEQVANLICEKYNVSKSYISMPDDLKTQYQSYTKADISKLLKYVDIEFQTVEDYLTHG